MSKASEFIREALDDFGPIKPFKPYGRIEGDHVEILSSNEPFFARRLNDSATIYYSERTGEVTGGRFTVA